MQNVALYRVFSWRVMDWNKKLMGLGLGWFLKGPIGAVLGGVLGTIFDEGQDEEENILDESQEKAIYHAYLVSLFVYIAKADGEISPVEVRIIRNFFSKKGLSSKEMIQIKDAMKIANKQQEINITAIVGQLNKIFDYSTRYNILELCYHIATADNYINPEELNALESMGDLMHIGKTDQYMLQMDYDFSTPKEEKRKENVEDDLDRLKREAKGDYSRSKKKTTQSQKKSSRNSYQNSYQKKNSSKNKTKKREKTAWEVLGVSEDASFKEVKKAYLDIVKTNHPDRFQDERKKTKAEEKIKKVNVAYQELKKVYR